MIHICIDCRFHNKSGIGRYAKEIVSRLIEHKNVFFTLIINPLDLDNAFIIKCNKDNVKFLNSTASMYSIREQVELPYIIPECDVFWSIHYNAPILPIRAKKKVVTIHDMAHIALANKLTIPEKIYSRFMMYWVTHMYNDIFTISQFSKDEIIKYEGIDEKKIHIYKCAPYSVDKYIESYSLKIKEKYNLPDNYVLFVGNVKPHKNLSVLVKAINLLSQKNDDIKLVIVGQKDGFINTDIEIKHDRNNVVFTGYVEDNDLVYIYKMANIFVFPSLYEGFGIPPLEAMKLGVPVICSSAASMPEVCGKAVEYFNPYDEVDLSNRINKLLHDKNKYNELIKIGKERSSMYSWDDTADGIFFQLANISK